jgi:hypothetical protein
LSLFLLRIRGDKEDKRIRGDSLSTFLLWFACGLSGYPKDSCAGSLVPRSGSVEEWWKLTEGS